MGVVSPSPWTRDCPSCHMRNQRFWVLSASGVVCPVCPRCFHRAMWRPGRDEQGRFGGDDRSMEGRIRALGHDREADLALRVFALAYLEDLGVASDPDLSALRLLEGGWDPEHPTRRLPPADPGTGRATGAHGAALGGQRAQTAASDTQADRGGGGRPGEATSEEPT